MSDEKKNKIGLLGKKVMGPFLRRDLQSPGLIRINVNSVMH